MTTGAGLHNSPGAVFAGVATVFSASGALLGATLLVTVALTGCGSTPVHDSSRIERPSASKTAPSVARKRGGGYYLDDGPGDTPPPDLDSIPEPVPQLEPLHRGAMRPYVVMGQTYSPMTELGPYKARGIASWYGRRYHGKQTSTGEVYDMYGMTAAHPLLPLPSYVRVTNVATGKSVIVRVNDRGPFIDNRLIDLSYTAAHRLGVLAGGSAVVQVEAVIPESAGSTAVAATRARANVAPSRSPINTTALAEPAAVTKSDAAEVDPIAAIAAAARDEASGMPALAEASATRRQTAPPSFPQPVSPDYAGVYLQMAAFGSRDNAESYLARIKTQLEWLAQLVQLVPSDGMFRVQAGPYASPTAARQAAERINSAIGTKPVLVTR